MLIERPLSMPEKQKPQPAIVKRAAVLIKDPTQATTSDVKKMAARILDDQKNDPQPHQKPRPEAVPGKKPSSKSPPRRKK